MDNPQSGPSMVDNPQPGPSGSGLLEDVLEERGIIDPEPVTNNPNNSYDSWDYSRIRQQRGGSLSVLAPRRQTQCDSHR